MTRSDRMSSFSSSQKNYTRCKLFYIVQLEGRGKRGEDCSSPSGAPDEPRERAQALLCPHQASRHLSTVLRRQLQRHIKEIQEHGGAGLRLPLTSASSGCGARRWRPHHRRLARYKKGRFTFTERARRWIVERVYSVEPSARMNRK